MRAGVSGTDLGVSGPENEHELESCIQQNQVHYGNLN